MTHQDKYEWITQRKKQLKGRSKNQLIDMVMKMELYLIDIKTQMEDKND